LRLDSNQNPSHFFVPIYAKHCTSDSARSSANAVSAETAAIENASTVVPTLFHQIAHEFPGVLDDGTLR